MPDKRIVSNSDYPDPLIYLYHLELGVIAKATQQQVILTDRSTLEQIIYRASTEEDARVQRLVRLLKHRFYKGLQVLIAHEAEFFKLYKEEVLGIASRETKAA